MTYLVEDGTSAPFCRNICRLCIQEDQTLWDIFGTCDDDGQSLKLAEKIIACLDIMVDINDGLPDLICAKCMAVIRSFFDFRQQCKDHDIMLRECLRIPDKHYSLEGEGETLIPDSLPLYFSRVNENTNSPCEPETLFERSGLQQGEKSNDPGTHRSETRDISLVKHLQEEWVEDDPSAVTNVMVDAKELELPWRISPEDLLEGRNASRISDLMAPEEHDPPGDYGNLNPRILDTDPLAIIVKREEKSKAVDPSSLCGLLELDNAEPDLEPGGTEAIGDERKQAVKAVAQLATEAKSNEHVGTEVLGELDRSKEDINLDVLNASKSFEQDLPTVVSKEMFGKRILRSNLGKWVCGICNIQYKALSKLKKHLPTHYSGHNQCPECQANFDSVEELVLHKSQHATSNLVLGHACQHCCKVFRLKHLLEKHIATQHVSSGSRKAPPKKFREKCGKCLRVFHSSFQMENHDESCGENASESEEESEVEHLTKSASSEKQQKMWECTLCRLIFKHFPSYSRHLNSVHSTEPVFKCDAFACGKVFRTGRRLHMHSLTHRERKVVCNQCPDLFMDLKSLKRHLAIHSNERPFKCDQCDATSKTRKDLTIHMYTHTKKWKCDQCDVQCSTKGLLKTHKDAHSATKLHVCEICGASYSQSIGLRDHKERNHSIGQRKVFKCKDCDRQYLDRFELCKHRKRKHQS